MISVTRAEAKENQNQATRPRRCRSSSVVSLSNRASTGLIRKITMVMCDHECDGGDRSSIASARAMAITKGSRHHAVTSLNAAQVRATPPSVVFDKPRSARIRARTGKGDAHDPINRAKGVNEVLGRLDCKPKATTSPQKKWIDNTAWLTRLAAEPLRRSPSSNSIRPRT